MSFLFLLLKQFDLSVSFCDFTNPNRLQINHMQFYDDDDEQEQLLLRNTRRKLINKSDPLKLPDQA